MLKGSKQRGSNRRAIMTDEQLPEMIELIGPEAAKDVRVLAYVFNGARDQEEFLSTVL